MSESEPPNPSANPQPIARRKRAVLVVAAVSLTVVLGMLAGFVTSTPPGLQWLVNAVASASGGSLQVEVASGRLSGPLHLTALRYSLPGLRIEARDIDLDWSPAVLAQRRLDIVRLDIGALDIMTRPTAAPPSLPSDLQLPVAVTIAHALVGRLRLLAWQDKPTATPLTLLTLEQVSGEFSSDGRHHTANSLRLGTPLGAMSGSIAIDGAAPFTLDGKARLEGRRDDRTYAVEAHAAGRLEAIDIAANAVGKDFKGSATIALTPFAPVPLRTAQIDIGEIDPAAFVPGAPQAALRLQARLSPQQRSGAANKSGPAEWLLGGTISLDNRTPGPLDRHALPLKRASADVSWKDGELALENVRLVAEGRVSNQLPGQASGRLTLLEQTLRGHLDLARIDPSTIFSTFKPARLAGGIELSVRSDRQSITARLNEARWRGEISAERADGRIEVRKLRLNAGKASLEASGSIEEAGHRQFVAKGRLKDFDPSLYIASTKATLNAEFDASGTVVPLAADVSFHLHDSQLITLDGLRQLTGHGQLALNADHLTNTTVQMDLAGNHIDANGAWGQPGDVLQFSVDAPRLATLGFGLDGALTLAGELSGDFAHPTGRITAAATALQLPGGVVASKVDFSGRLGAGPDSPLEANLSVSGLTLGERGTTIESATLGLDGTRQAHTLHGRFVEVDVGSFDIGSADLTAHGALADGLHWQGWLDRVDLRLPGGVLTLATAAPLSAAPDHVTLGAADLRGEMARLNLLESHWSTTDWQTRGSLSGLRVDVAAGPGAPDKIHGNLTVGGVWNLRARDHVEGSLQLYREAGDLTLPGDRLVTLGLSEVALAATAIHDRIEATLLATGERFGKLQGSATVRLEQVDGRWRLAQTAPLLAEAKVDLPSLQWLGPLLNPNLTVGGHALGEMHIAGTLAKPEARGSLQADAVSIMLIDEGLRLDEGSLRIDLLQNRARLSAFSFRTEPRGQPPAGMRLADPALAKAPGWLKGSGELSLIDGSGELRFEAEHLAILQRQDRWLMLTGSGNLKTVGEVLAVDGALRADAGYFELAAQSPPSLGDDVIVRRRGVKNVAEATVEKKVPLRFTVDLGLELGPRLYFKGRGIDTRLAGELRLRADKPGALRASGSIRTHDGTFDAYGQSLAIERGVLNFHGPISQPSLNVLALRKGLAVEAGVEITGSVDSPKVRLISEPEVPDPEKLSWIILGHGLDQAGADNGLLLSAAAAIFGGPNGGGLTRRLANGLGLDQISLTQGNPNATGSLLPTTTVAGSTARSDSTSLSSQIVTLGKRLGDNAYLAYEQSLAGAVNVVKLSYQLSRRLSLVGRAGTDNSLDLTYTFSFH